MGKIIRRILTIIPAVALQSLWLLLLMKWLTPYAPIIVSLLSVAAFFLVVFIIIKRDETAYKLLWLLVILSLPLVGALLYLLFGNKRTARPLKRRLQQVQKSCNPQPLPIKESNHIKPEVNYREFRIHKLNTPEFSHVRLLLYWPIFGLLFLFLERLQPQRNYYPVYCGLDDIIPFCEWALIPYLFWFVFLIGTLVYTFFVDVPAFRRMMYFVIVTYTITVLIYLFFPTCQNLRPEAFVRNNLLTRFIELFYSFDTNTNVCPSLHVIGSVAAMFGLWDCKALQSVGWKIAATSIAVCISLSTVFMKQHSIMDVLAALPVCFFGWWIAYKILPNNKTNRFLTRM